MSEEELLKNISRLKSIISSKWGTDNQQDIDGEILAWISLYKYGNKDVKKRAAKVLKQI